MDQQTFMSLEQQVGRHFLQYILNYNNPIKYSTSWEELNFSIQQVAVLEDLFFVLSECGKAAASAPMYGVTYFLFQEGTKDNSRFNQYRSICGGNLYCPESTDPIESYLFNYTANIYPCFLIVPIMEPKIINLGSVTEIKQDTDPFFNLLKNDSCLYKLLNGDELLYNITYLLDGGPLVSSMKWSILIDFVYRCFLNCCYRMDYSLEQVIQEIRVAIMMLRKICNGEEFEFSSFRGLYGLRMKDLGTLQFRSDIYFRLITSVYSPAKNVRNTASLINSEMAGVIVEFKQKIRPVPFPLKQNSSSYTNHDSNELINLFKFAIVFSTESVYSPFTETFIDYSLPFHKTFYVDKLMSGGGEIITPENQSEVFSWLNLLYKTDLKHVTIPITRLQYAIFERLQPIDSLLDAFIAWEGMFSAKFETVFQVTGSMAKFLEPDVNARRAFVKRLKELYSLRSDLAHGNSKENKLIKREGIGKLRNEVLEIGLKCLKKILISPEFLKLSPEDRVKEILVFS
jgi:hypothetical protein